ncbi:MAG: septum formation initiator family protein [SAR86 cluster bacterium]|jgi:cell division protein FtsB|nr:septum formation initiator family protein [SAR86 cluster bacterium]
MFNYIYKNKYLLMVISILLIFILYLQYSIWFGNANYFKLQAMQTEIKILESENKELFLVNEELTQDKLRLGAGKEAIEGLARRELGLIKPDEVFYSFSEDEE